MGKIKSSFPDATTVTSRCDPCVGLRIFWQFLIGMLVAAD